MDNLAAKNLYSSSGCSTVSSGLDIKTSKSCQKPSDHKLNTTRSRSFLYCLSKHLGRHFIHHHRQHEAVFNSQEDIRSSSTDSFSLSFERASHIECNHIINSSIDLTTEERSSRDSSASGYSRFSPPFCPLESDALDFDEYQHIYVNAYNSNNGLSHNADDLSSEDDADVETNTDANDNQENRNPHRYYRKHSKMLQASTTLGSTITTPLSGSSITTSKTGLHLSRISISSSVSRIFSHFSTSSNALGSASMRSLSCSSTPLRRAKPIHPKNHKANSENNTNTQNNGKKSVTTSTSVPSSSINYSAPKKKEKKQQSILRPPVHYVYMKGMSGLYSRVPRYTVCCSYTTQQFA